MARSFAAADHDGLSRAGSRPGRIHGAGTVKLLNPGKINRQPEHTYAGDFELGGSASVSGLPINCPMSLTEIR